MLITGLEGPITIASAARSASSTSRLGSACSIPSSSTPSTSGSPRSTIRYSCRSRRPAAVSDLGADRRVRHRQHLRLDPEAAGDLRLGVGLAAALLEELAPVEAGGEVAVGEAEPARRAEPLQALEDGEGVLADPPAALLVDFAAEPVGDEVGVGGDVDAERLDVVAGVGDHRQFGAELLLHPGAELGAAGAAGEERDPHRRSMPSGRRRAGR